MKAWLISIVCITIMEVIFFIIIPNGKLTGVIKSIFSFVLIMVIVSPILKIKNENFSFEEFFQNESISVQENYIDYVYNKNQHLLKERISVILQNNNVKYKEISLIFDDESVHENKIKNIKIILIKDENSSSSEHIYTIEQIKKEITEKISVDKSKIEITY